MNRSRFVAVAVVVIASTILVVGPGALVLSGNGELVFSGNGDSGTQTQTGDSGGQTQGSLTANWVSDTARNVSGNHHVAIGGQPGGNPMVFAPVSGEVGRDGGGGTHDHSGHGHQHDHGSRSGNGNQAASGCGLIALNGTSGDAQWTYEVSPENCTIHAVADPTLADVDGDGAPEIVVMYGDGRVASLSYDESEAK